MIPNTHYDDASFSNAMFDKAFRLVSVVDYGAKTYSCTNKSDGYEYNKKDAANFMYQCLIIDSNNDICDIDLIPIFSQCMDDEILMITVLIIHTVWII